MWNGLHPTISVPHDPIAIAEMTASLIRADARRGGAAKLPATAVYIEDPARGPNMLLAPAETSVKGGGQCFDLTRATGGYYGTHVGCVRSPAGFHVFLAFIGAGDPIIYDEAKLRGMDGDPDYAGAVYVPIWQAPPGTVGRSGHDVPPNTPGMDGDVDQQAEAVRALGGALIESLPESMALRGVLERELAVATDPARRESLAALLLAVRALTEPTARSVVIDQIRGPLTRTSAQILGALSALSGHAWRTIQATVTAAPRTTYAAPSFVEWPPPMIPSGTCPGSCVLKGG